MPAGIRQPDDPTAPRVLVIDDDPLVRRELRERLGRHGVPVVADTDDPTVSVSVAREAAADVVLVDAHLPLGGAFAAASALRRDAPGVPVVFLAARPDDDLALLALRAGGSGFLAKDIDAAALARSLRGVARGEAAFSRAMTATLIEWLGRGAGLRWGMRPIRSPLTTREWEILDLMCAGAGTRHIAEDLGVSPETVRTHVKHILVKLGVHSRAEAVLAAERMRSPPGLDERALRREYELIASLHQG